MKKIQVLFMALSFMLLAAACHPGKHTTIHVSDGVNDTRLEYSGRIVFSDDLMSISNMSPGGYFKFKSNDDELSAKRDDKGHIIYELNNGAQSTKLDEDGKRLIQEAAKQIAKAQGKKI